MTDAFFGPCAMLDSKLGRATVGNRVYEPVECPAEQLDFILPGAGEHKRYGNVASLAPGCLKSMA
jgi:hypothetical protein